MVGFTRLEIKKGIAGNAHLIGVSIMVTVTGTGLDVINGCE